MSLNPNTFIEYNSFFHVIPENRKILIAFSGGVDSVVLTHLLYKTRQYFKIKSLALCYVNHHLRDDTDQDIAFARSFADQLGIPLFIEDVYPNQLAKEKKQSLEECARQLRYEVLENVAKNNSFEIIATAHHKTDLAETLLQRLIEGTGIQGLSGIALKTGTIIRPLLFFTRQEIESYAVAQNLSFRKDYSNDDLRYKRNKIRHLLIPFIKEQFNAKIEDALFRLALNAKEWQEFIEQNLSLYTHKLLPGVIRIEREKLSDSPAFMQKIVFEDALNSLEPSLFITFNKWKQLHNRLNSESGHFIFNDAIRIGWDKKNIWVYRKESDYSYPLSEGEFTLPFHLKLSVTKTRITDLKGIRRLSAKTSGKKWKPFEKIWVTKNNFTDEVVIASPKEGDEFQPLGSDYKVKVIRYLKDKGLPEPLIHSWPVIRMKNNEVIAIPGLMPAENWKVTWAGEEVLEIRIFNFENFFV